MRIEFERSGGFVGNAPPLKATFDTESLPSERVEQLEHAVDELNLDSLTEAGQAPSGRPDRFQYDLTITRDSERHRISVSENQAPSELKPLLRLLTEMAREERGRTSGGS
jgi:hypothetical protein